MSATTRRGLQIDDPLAPSRDTAVDVEDGGTGRLRDLPLEQIRANPAQPRKHFDDAALASLAASIRERGVLQPIIVRPVAPATNSSPASGAGAPPSSPANRPSPRSSTTRSTTQARWSSP